jgi:hypothetical protein
MPTWIQTAPTLACRSGGRHGQIVHVQPASESEPEGNLQPSWWLRRDWLAEER